MRLDLLLHACCVMIGYIVWFRITGSLSIIIVYGMFEVSFTIENTSVNASTIELRTLLGDRLC